MLVTAAWVYSYEFEQDLRSYAFGTVGWPRTILVLMAICAVGWCGTELRRSRGPHQSIAEQLPRGEPVTAQAWLKILGTFLLPLLYVWLLPRMGYFATTPFFIAGYAILFGQRRLRNIVLVVCIVWGTSILVFAKLLYVPLPTGNWPGFYEFSNALLRLVR